MKILVSSPTIFIGRALIKELAHRGHKAYGLVTNDEDALKVKSDGGTAVYGDLLHGGDWCNKAQKADSVISLNEPFEGIDVMAKKDFSKKELSEIGRRHVEKVTNLMKAAADGKTRNFILVNNYLVLGDRKGKWASDDDSLSPVAFSRPLEGYIDSIYKVSEETGIPLVHAMVGMMYGNGDWFTELTTDIKDGHMKHVGSGEYYWSVIHVDDAAAMLANAAEKIDKSVEFFVTDDRPVMVKEFMNHIAGNLGIEINGSMSIKEFMKEYGKVITEAVISSTRAPGLKAFELLGYYPKFRSYETGIEATLKEMGLAVKKTNLSRAA